MCTLSSEPFSTGQGGGGEGKVKYVSGQGIVAKHLLDKLFKIVYKLLYFCKHFSSTLKFSISISICLHLDSC